MNLILRCDVYNCNRIRELLGSYLLMADLGRGRFDVLFGLGRLTA
jgi:hypothetical protein